MTIFLYSCAFAYILFAVIAPFSEIPPHYANSAGVVAFFISCFDFFEASFKIVKDYRKRETLEKLVKWKFSWRIICKNAKSIGSIIGLWISLIFSKIAILSAVSTAILGAFILEKYKDDLVVISQLGNYVTFSAIGVVFLTKAMASRYSVYVARKKSLMPLKKNVD
ncbi:hypothetical protein [Brevibacillus sp. SIMBA_040]|uniref:hypothetical protein n=1 Tax=unclassified Brevibacillus TaxID=2684853 RepID=UPI00397D0ADD